jgi:hypothetical protein
MYMHACETATSVHLQQCFGVLPDLIVSDVYSLLHGCHDTVNLVWMLCLCRGYSLDYQHLPFYSNLTVAGMLLTGAGIMVAFG